MRSHRRLQVWLKSSDLTEGVYRLTGTFPRSEMFGLTQQMRRAVVSVVSNIAEGAARSSDAEFARFLDIAMSSAGELQAQLDVAKRLRLASDNALLILDTQVDEIKRMIVGLRKKVSARSKN
ncbi:MAG: four helix bundle protein [Actinomycetota bacterium]|nr:four helix bundle protein [Actinomycetota bacterium]